MNQALPAHPPFTHSAKLAPNKSGDAFPKLQKGELLQDIGTGEQETRPDKGRQDTDNPDIENEFSAALLILSPIETIKNTVTSKNIVNVQNGIILSGQILAGNGNTPQAEIHKNKISLTNNAVFTGEKNIENPQDINLQNTIASKIAATVTASVSTSPATNTAGQTGNAHINQIQILAPTNPEIQANPEIATHKAAEFSPPIRVHRNAQDKTQIDKARVELSSIQISPAGSTDTNFGKIPMISTAQSQAIITQLSDAVTLQAGKAISGSVSDTIAGTISTTQTKPGQPPGPILVQLSPAELGRVHIQFSFDAADKITAHIIAESAETGALLKRNSELLTAHLKLGGFDNIDLNFETKSEKSFLDFTQNNSKNSSNMFANTDGQPSNKSGNESGNEFGQTTDHDAPNIGQQALAPSMRPLATPNMDQLDISI